MPLDALVGVSTKNHTKRWGLVITPVNVQLRQEMVFVFHTNQEKGRSNMSERGFKLDEARIICPYCYKVNDFAQGMITRSCKFCGKGYFRDLKSEDT
jgi:competence transcription factor ComK